LALAPTRPLPAPHQHGDFLVAAHKRGEIALSGTAPAATGADEPEQGRRFGHSFECLRAALFRNKQASDLTLYPRRDQDRARLGQCLHTRRSVRRIAVNLSCRVDHYRAGFDTDARVERWLARAGVLTVDFCKRALDRERRPNRTFSVVFLRDRIAEQRHQPITQFFGDVAAHLRHGRRGYIEIAAD
jgi:hypothetical protein